MNKQLAFVFGGGGARGALQAGALRALVQAGLKPDLLVGTSIGAITAAFWALHGQDLAAVDALDRVWEEAASANLLPSNYLWLTVRTLFNRPDRPAPNSIRDFVVAHGVTPEMTFAQVPGVRLVLVASDLNNHAPMLYGLDPQHNLLEGVLASTALPPWVRPIDKEGRLLMDGGIVSNVPIDIALSLGATEIIALDLSDPRQAPAEAHGFGSFLGKLMQTVEQRQTDMALALAEARRVPVLYLRLLGPEPIQVWEFQPPQALIARGYEIAQQALPAWLAARRPWWQRISVKWGFRG